MIVWSGLGIFVPVIAGFALFVAQALLGTDASRGSGAVLAMLLAAACVWVLGTRLNARPADAIRTATGGRRARARHTLLFIPMQFWAPLFVVAGIAAALGGR